MRLNRHSLLASVLLSSVAPVASAEVITLTFEGAGDNAQLLNFYNGGTDSAGNTGTNYGVVFGSNARSIIDRDAGGSGNFANEPSPSAVMYFLTGTAVLNYSPGFSDGFSFYYTSSQAASVQVYSGLNRTGTLLGTIPLVAQSTANNCQGDPQGGPEDPFGQFCNWSPVGLAFAGVARSIDFSGTVNQVAFDNITFGASVPTPTVPEPPGLPMYLLGGAAILVAARGRQRVALQSEA